MKHFILRGVPASIANDAWWLSPPNGGAPTGPASAGEGGTPPGPDPRALAGVAALVVLGDHLFWGHAVGLSLALFALAVFAIAGSLAPARHDGPGPAILAVLSLLPLVEMVQLLSVTIAAAGLLVALAWVSLPHGGLDAEVARRLRRLLRALPLSGARALIAALRALFADRTRGDGAQWARRAVRNWAFPVGGGLVLAALIIGANPVIDRALGNMLDVDVDFAAGLRRGLFWLGLALVAWPLVSALGDPDPAPRARARGARRPWLHDGAVRRALVVFNLVLAVQTATDASVFLAGAELPPGMGYASYAHRGAYPLLVATLLGGGFALAARPHVAHAPELKPLLLAWLGQNILMGAAAAFRLALYVEAYGLTYLRLRALIWIALVIAGLGLTLWQILHARSNRWLVVHSAALALATLYGASFVNFAHVIARWNLAHAVPAERATDIWYVRSLGPMASAAVAAHLADHPGDAEGWDHIPTPQIDGWRDWGFRSWRVRRYLSANLEAAAPQEESAGEDPARR